MLVRPRRDSVRLAQAEGLRRKPEDRWSRLPAKLVNVPNGIRTRVLALKGPRPGPLDDGDVSRADYSPRS